MILAARDYMWPVLGCRIVAQSTEVSATTEADNLLLPGSDTVWRTDGTSTQYVEFDLPMRKMHYGTPLIRFVALLYNNATSTSTWRIRADADQADLTGTPSYDSGTINMWKNASSTHPYGRVHSWHEVGDEATARAYRYWRIDITLGTESYHQSSVAMFSDALFFGPDYTTYGSAQGLAYGYGWGFDRHHQSYQPRHTKFSQSHSYRRRVRLPMWGLQGDPAGGGDYGYRLAAHANYRAGHELFLITDPADTTHWMERCMYGHFDFFRVRRQPKQGVSAAFRTAYIDTDADFIEMELP
jgi:hypothetical protein